MSFGGRIAGYLVGGLIFFSFIGYTVAQTSGSVDYEYDDIGRLTKVIYRDNLGAFVSSVIYSYDPAGNRTVQTVDTVGDAIPVAVDDSLQAFLDTPKTFDPRTNDTDEYGDPLTIVSATQGANGTVSVAVDGTAITYTPNTAFTGSDSFTYIITDGIHTPAPATVSVVVDIPVTFSIQADASVTEGVNAIFTVTKSQTNSTTETIAIGTMTGGTAVSGADFTASSQVLSFAPAELSKTFAVTTTQDTIYEGAESFTVQLSNPSEGGVLGAISRTGTITNDDAGPTFAVNDVAVSEGGNAVFTITKTGATALSHNVSRVTADGSATSVNDYTAQALAVITFAPTEIAKTVTVATTQDATNESDETFTLNLSAATNGATISDNQGVGVIGNDDGPPSFAIADAVVSEGGLMTFTVTKAGQTSLPYSVNFATSTGTAASGTDFTASSGALTFAPTETSKTFAVATIEDAVFENAETLTGTLSSATNGATIADSQGVGTISNDDTAPSFVINNVSGSEGNVLTFTVTKSGATALSHNVSYATANGSAAAGSDYNATSGTLTYSPTQTSQTVVVSTIENGTFEANETTYVNLSSATNGATIADSQGSGTITNDDVAPSFSINNVTRTEGNILTFTVTKSGATALSHSVNYATANGSAVAGADYTTKSGTLSFTAAQTSQIISIVSVEDTTTEATETFNVNLSGATSGAVISDSLGVGTITDDDLNTAPVANNDSYSHTAPYVHSLAVLSNDTDAEGDALTITAVTQPTQGIVYIVGGTLEYHLPSNTGTYTFNYTISDGRGGTATATVTYTVSPSFPCCGF